MKLNKDNFLKSELGSNLIKCVTAWDKWLNELGKTPHSYESVRVQKAANSCQWCQAQWEVYKMAVKQFYGIDYCFSRTNEYFGVCTEDETDWLFKISRSIEGPKTKFERSF